MTRSEGSIILPDGARCGIRKAAIALGTTEDFVLGAVRRVGHRYEDIRRDLFPRDVDDRVEALDANEVYTLARYSKGQKDHREILMQLLGLDASDEKAFMRRFPDA